MSQSQRITFVDNHIHDSWGECLIAFFLKDGAIRGNRIHDCWSVSAYLDHATNVDVERNFIYVTKDTYNRAPDKSRRAHGIAFAVELYDPPAYANEDILVANNLIVGTQTGLFFWDDSRNKSAQNTYRNLRAVHNVFADVRGSIVSFAGVASTATKPSGSVFAANVAIARTGSPTVSIGNADAWSFRQNDFVGGVPALAKEPGSFALDPQFTSATIASGPEGYRPKSGSPLIGAATIHVEVSRDYWCAPRTEKTSLGLAH